MRARLLILIVVVSAVYIQQYCGIVKDTIDSKRTTNQVQAALNHLSTGDYFLIPETIDLSIEKYLKDIIQHNKTAPVISFTTS